MEQISNKNWQTTKKTALKRYKNEVLGERPTKRSVDKDLHDETPITILQKLSFVLLVVAALFSGMKFIDEAILYTSNFEGIDFEAGKILFSVIGSAVAFLMATTGLIFTKLQASDPSTIAKIKKNRIGWHNFLNLDVLTPRLWGILTYFVIIWLFVASSQADGNWFMQYLPVLFEVLLANVVADIIEHRRKRSNTVHSVWEAQALAWDARFADLHSPEYLKILYQTLREALTPSTKRGNGRFAYKSVAEAERANEVLDQWVKSEYRRVTSGVDFAKWAVDKQVDEAQIAKNVVIKAKTTAKNTAIDTKKRIPPDGAARWTAETLTEDFLRRGLKRTQVYTEKNLAQDYAAGFSVRTAYRKDAKVYFKGVS